jgi:hypothetical protein
MKTPNIQNLFKMMIGTSALIASTAFFINTISPVQASESKEVSSNPDVITNAEIWHIPDGTIVGCGNSIYQWKTDREGGGREGIHWVKVGP